MYISSTLKIISCVFFSIGNYLTKKCAIPGAQLFCYQSFLGSLFLIPFVSSFSWKKSLSILWVLRFVLGALGSLFWVYSLKKLSLFDVMSLQFVTPLMTTLGAVFFLKEPMNRFRFSAILLSFVGALFVTVGRWSGENQSWIWGPSLFLPVFASLCSGGVNLLSKKIFDQSNIILITFQQFFMNGLVVLFVSLMSGRCALWHSLSRGDLYFLFCLTLCVVMAHLCLCFAMIYADLLVLIPLGSIRALLTIAWGLLFLNERPGMTALCGTILIIVSMGVLSCSAKRPSL